MQFLFCNLIRRSKEHGFVELDFGQLESTNTGLVTFKDRSRTKRQLITYLRYPALPVTSQQHPWMLTKFSKKVFSRCPQGVLRLAGNLLYPHVS
jgi:hypothetical protein